MTLHAHTNNCTEQELFGPQVMDYKKSTNDKVLKDKKPDHTLISFFGDDSYGWFPKGRDIIPFHKNYDTKSRQPTAKKVTPCAC